MALTADQITAKNFKEFYDKIFPYLNGGLARNNYSTDEQVVGTWIDGKPLYQKTVEITTPSALDTNTNVYDLSSLSISNIVYMNGYIINSTGNEYPLNYHNKGTQDYATTWYRSGAIGMAVGSDSTKNKTAYVTLQYTKTTD